MKKCLAAGDKLATQTKYFILLPTNAAHGNYHPTSGTSGFSQRVHSKIIEKINALVGEGTTEVQEVKRALRHYVLHLFPDPTDRPSESNRAYYPTSTDIKNHVYSAKRAQELSKLDQDNLKLKIEQWKKENPATMFYYRPYALTETELQDNHEGTTDDQQEFFSQTLLYVHQEHWQQELLRRYGNTIVLIDAIYKTTKYELPMFFVTVKTNVGYTPIADFVIQSETGIHIEEALKVLTTWNPDWRPPYFMTDYSDAEIHAIESVFPECKVYLCDFHREQAWERWVKDRKHGLSPTDGEILLGKLRSCAWAQPGSDGAPVDSHFQQAVDDLRKTSVWKDNQQVQDWLNAKWLQCPKVSWFVALHT